jgi:hypothetical protein
VTADLLATIDAAVAARTRLGARPVRETAVALAEAARRWRDDPALAENLPTACDLTPAMVRSVVPLVADAIDADALVDLHARERGREPAPVLVAHVLASNVPALAVPAIALGCLAGAAVVVKSGRADTVSAPAFHRALASVDPALAATVVATYWPGGDRDLEDAVFTRADLIVATGSDATIERVAHRHGAKVLGHGDRTSLAVVSDASTDDDLRSLALDVARYEQRGCLSPHAVLTLGDPDVLTERVLSALTEVAKRLPAPVSSPAARAARRVALEAARFDGATVVEADGGAVVIDAPSPARAARAPTGHRTVRVVRGDDVAAWFPPGSVECVGIAAAVGVDAQGLRRHGVARICPVGRMQRPPIDWPRGQRPALGSLFRRCREPRIQVET